jgi:hypothetical protein
VLHSNDSIDAVAGAMSHFQRAMMMDVDQAAKAMKEAEIEAEIEDFLEGFNQTTYRGMRVNGVRVATWSSQHGCLVTAGRMPSGSNTKGATSDC